MDGDGDLTPGKVPRKRARAETTDRADASVLWEAPDAKQARTDSSAVFIRGLPEGISDSELRQWLEANAGPTVTCYRIRDDYGLAKFKDESDARRCLEDLKNAKLQGHALQFEIAKPKRKSAVQRSSGSTAPAAQKPTTAGPQKEDGLDLCDVLLKGLPAGLKQDGLRAWVEEQLPGGAGIENIRAVGGTGGAPEATPASGSSFTVRFRREANARRAVEALGSAELKGHKVSATFRSLEMSRTSAKGGRLIVRNLAFGATLKHVRKAFAELGELTDVHLPLKNGDDKGGNQQHRGFAFVQYADSSVSERAVSELNGVKICGRGVAVDWAMDAKLYGAVVRQDDRKKTKKEEPVEKPGKTDNGGHNKDEKSEEEDERDADTEEDSEDESEEEEKDEDEEAARIEVRRMKKLLGEDGASKANGEKKDAKGKARDEKKKEEKEKRTPGYDVGEGRTLFVRNCPFDATHPELLKIFGKFGKVASVKLVADRSGQNDHNGSAFIKYQEAEGLASALAVEEDADRKLKELSSVIKRSDQRDLAAVEGFGVALRGRRLVLKQALAPGEVKTALEERKPDKGKAKEERSSWMHLLSVGDINEHHENWKLLSKSEKRQRAASMKERKFRINNSNFAIHPQRLSVRNLPRTIDAQKVREVLVRHLAQQSFVEGEKKQDRRRAAEALLVKVDLVRDSGEEARRDDDNARRSRGFGFINFKDNKSALAGLECLNDNATIFGGGKRPIVEFAIEDKRKLRMQEELFNRHAHKLLPGAQEQGKGKDGQAKGKGKGDAAVQGKGKGDGKGKEPETSASKILLKLKRKRVEKREAARAGTVSEEKAEKPAKPMSRGQRQRESRRKRKVAEAEKSDRREVHQVRTTTSKKAKKVEAIEKTQLARKKAKRNEPDAGAISNKRARTQRPGEMSDDFELRAMERMRSGKR